MTDPARGRASARTAGHGRRKPWWVMLAGLASVLGWSGWVAAQPLPAAETSPQLQAVDAQLQQEDTVLNNLSAQAQQWQAQRDRVAAALRQEEGMIGQPAANVGGGSAASMPVPRAVTFTRGS